METIHRLFSVELAIVFLALLGVLRVLVKDAQTMSERRFVRLSVIAGLLACLLLAVTFRTSHVAPLFDLPIEGLSEQRLSWVKAAIALAAAGLSAYDSKRRAARMPHRACWSKGVALSLAVLSIGAYARFGDFGYSNFYHRWEFFHYYLGSKYNRELGYERLYQCTAVAQADMGQRNEVMTRKLRDLTVDLLVPARKALEHPEECRDRFATAERWEAFKTDVKFFRASTNLQWWTSMQEDHGYNPPPVWTAMGYLWASLHPATDGYLKFLASFDPLLMAAMFGAINWAFGSRVACVAAIFWGCQLPGEYFWWCGAFLRQDWVVLLVLSACFIRKRYYALGGAAFAYSTLLRVFPGVLLVGWVVVAGAHYWKHRRLSAQHLRVMWGGVAATAALVAISIAVAGVDSYPEFYKHIQVHNHTGLTNNMGLTTLLQHSYAGRMEFVQNAKAVDPFATWGRIRLERLHAFRPLQLVLLAALGLAFIKVVGRVKSLWVAQALSLGIVITVVELTCYYYAMFILAAFLSRRRPGVEQWVLCVAGVSQLLAVNRFLSTYYDDRYAAQSVLFCLFGVTLLAAYWRPWRRAARRSPAPSSFTPPAPT